MEARKPVAAELAEVPQGPQKLRPVPASDHHDCKDWARADWGSQVVEARPEGVKNAKDILRKGVGTYLLAPCSVGFVEVFVELPEVIRLYHVGLTFEEAFSSHFGSVFMQFSQKGFTALKSEETLNERETLFVESLVGKRTQAAGSSWTDLPLMLPDAGDRVGFFNVGPYCETLGGCWVKTVRLILMPPQSYEYSMCHLSKLSLLGESAWDYLDKENEAERNPKTELAAEPLVVPSKQLNFVGVEVVEREKSKSNVSEPTCLLPVLYSFGPPLTTPISTSTASPVIPKRTAPSPESDLKPKQQAPVEKEKLEDVGAVGGSLMSLVQQIRDAILDEGHALGIALGQLRNKKNAKTASGEVRPSMIILHENVRNLRLEVDVISSLLVSILEPLCDTENYSATVFHFLEAVQMDLQKHASIANSNISQRLVLEFTQSFNAVRSLMVDALPTASRTWDEWIRPRIEESMLSLQQFGCEREIIVLSVVGALAFSSVACLTSGLLIGTWLTERLKASHEKRLDDLLDRAEKLLTIIEGRGSLSG